MKTFYGNLAAAAMTSVLFVACFDSGSAPTGSDANPNTSIEQTPGYTNLETYKLKLIERQRIDAIQNQIGGTSVLSKSSSATGTTIGWIKGRNACGGTNGPTPQINLRMDDEDSYTENNLFWSNASGTLTGGGFPFDLTSQGLSVLQKTDYLNESEINFCVEFNPPILYPASQDYAVLSLGSSCPSGGYRMALTVDNEDNGNVNLATCTGNCAGNINSANPLDPGYTTTGGVLVGSTKLFLCFVPKATSQPTGPIWAVYKYGAFGGTTISGYTDRWARMRITAQVGNNTFTKHEFYDSNPAVWTDNLRGRAKGMFLYPFSSNLFLSFNYKSYP